MSLCCRSIISSPIDLLGKPNTVLCTVSPLMSIYETNCLQSVVSAVGLSTLAILQFDGIIRIISESLPKESTSAKDFLSPSDYISFTKSEIKSNRI